MRILYAGTLTENDSALYRLWALERLGHTVIPMHFRDYEAKNALVRKVQYRFSAGPGVLKINAAVLRIAAEERIDLFWADKILWIRPETLTALRTMGVTTVSYMIDNPFGSRRDPGWRLYLKDVPFYDLHVVQRDRNLAEYREHGARNVIKIQTAYEPSIHYPPPDGWSDRDRDRGVSFIGTPYDDRAAFLTRLWKEFDLPVVVSGGLVWRPALGAEATAGIYRNSKHGTGELFCDEYREGIWRSKINLSFLTHSNQDEFAHKSFEIAGCGGFLLAERSDGHRQRFREDEEAVFFSSIEECVAKIRQYLPNEEARTRIATAGHARAVRDGYHNDRQIEIIMGRVMEMLPKVRAGAGSGS